LSQSVNAHYISLGPIYLFVGLPVITSFKLQFCISGFTANSTFSQSFPLRSNFLQNTLENYSLIIFV